MNRSRALRRLFDVGLLVFVVVIAGAVAFFMVATVDPVHHIDEQKILTALFFSIQTITTTGYGAGFDANDEVKIVGCVFMILGSITWSVFIAQLASLFVTELVQKKVNIQLRPRR